jgi:hypothetical protein
MVETAFFLLLREKVGKPLLQVVAVVLVVRGRQTVERAAWVGVLVVLVERGTRQALPERRYPVVVEAVALVVVLELAVEGMVATPPWAETVPRIRVAAAVAANQ